MSFSQPAARNTASANVADDLTVSETSGSAIAAFANSTYFCCVSTGVSQPFRAARAASLNSDRNKLLAHGLFSFNSVRQATGRKVTECRSVK